MDLMQLGTQLLSEKLGLQVDANTVSSALSGLLGDGQGNVDFASLATKIASSGELGNVLPQVMDKASSGGSLLESVGGLGGLMGAASSFLK